MDATKAESVVNLLGGNRLSVLALANAFLAAGSVLLWRAIAPAVRWLPLLACARVAVIRGQ